MTIPYDVSIRIGSIIGKLAISELLSKVPGAYKGKDTLTTFGAPLAWHHNWKFRMLGQKCMVWVGRFGGLVPRPWIWALYSSILWTGLLSVGFYYLLIKPQGHATSIERVLTTVDAASAVVLALIALLLGFHPALYQLLQDVPPSESYSGALLSLFLLNIICQILLSWLEMPDSLLFYFWAFSIVRLISSLVIFKYVAGLLVVHAHLKEMNKNLNELLESNTELDWKGSNLVVKHMSLWTSCETLTKLQAPQILLTCLHLYFRLITDLHQIFLVLLYPSRGYHKILIFLFLTAVHTGRLALLLYVPQLLCKEADQTTEILLSKAHQMCSKEQKYEVMRLVTELQSNEFILRPLGLFNLRLAVLCDVWKSVVTQQIIIMTFEKMSMKF